MEGHDCKCYKHKMSRFVPFLRRSLGLVSTLMSVALLQNLPKASESCIRARILTQGQSHSQAHILFTALYPYTSPSMFCYLIGRMIGRHSDQMCSQMCGSNELNCEKFEIKTCRVLRKQDPPTTRCCHLLDCLLNSYRHNEY